MTYEIKEKDIVISLDNSEINEQEVFLAGIDTGLTKCYKAQWISDKIYYIYREDNKELSEFDIEVLTSELKVIDDKINKIYNEMFFEEWCANEF